jgi:hypothetical protein
MSSHASSVPPDECHSMSLYGLRSEYPNNRQQDLTSGRRRERLKSDGVYELFAFMHDKLMD